MQAGSSYKMYGIFPIQCTENGGWYVDIAYEPLRAAAEGVLRGLLGVNAVVEVATFHHVKMLPPIKRVETEEPMNTASN